MAPVHSTDYFAVIPKVGAPIAVLPTPVSDEMFHWQMATDVSLLALVFGAAATVAGVILNWSH